MRGVRANGGGQSVCAVDAKCVAAGENSGRERAGDSVERRRDEPDGGREKTGYHVYLEATLEQAATAAEAGAKAGSAGIMLQGTATQQSQVEESTRKLRAQYPKLKILPLSAAGKQPEMRGWLVFNKNGMLQVSSPSAQPWLDQNLASVRQERAFDGGQAPLYTFTWDESDPLVERDGPKPADYSLAVAEAGAFHADLVLELYEVQQKGLASGDKEALEDWEPVKRTIAFYEREKAERKKRQTWVC